MGGIKRIHIVNAYLSDIFIFKVTILKAPFFINSFCTWLNCRRGIRTSGPHQGLLFSRSGAL